MDTKLVRNSLLFIVIGAALIATSCSSGPEPPKPGTPAFFWVAAKEAYAAGDYQAASEHLERVCRSQSEFTTRAQAWNLIMTSGMANAYMELADNFEFGYRARRMNPTQFRRMMSDYRTYASRLSLQFAQTLLDFQKNNKDQQILLDFTFPTGSALPSPQLTKIGNGEFPTSAILDDVRKQHLRTGVILATCHALGAADDSAKGQEILKSGSVKIPRETFMLAMAEALQEQAELFGRSKLDQPDRLKMYSSNALETIKALPETDQTKKLSAKIEKTLKLVSDKK